MTHSVHLLQPCEAWPFDPVCCDLPEVDPEWGIDVEAVIDRQSKAATDILWQLTGRKFATGCTTTLRLRPPCRGSCGGGCRLRVEYAGTHIEPVSVSVGGDILDEADWTWQAPWLCLNTGCSCSCQSGCIDCAAAGSVCVDVEVGAPLNDSGIAAYSTFVCELVKGCLPIECGCRLPPGILEIVSQGMRIRVADLESLTHLTGIHEVDMWIRAENPYRARQPSWLSSPELHQPARR
jgi:hypothetical protein